MNVNSCKIIPFRSTTDCGAMGTKHGIDIRRSISSQIASLARTGLLPLACLLLVVAISSWYLHLSGGQSRPASSRLQLVEHRLPLSDMSLLPHRRRLVGSSGDNCTRMCGNVSIPYPFGLSAECARDSYFQLRCRKISGVTGYNAQIVPGDYPFLTKGVQGSFQENGTVSLKEHFLDSFRVLRVNLTDATITIDTTKIKASSCDYVQSVYKTDLLGNASILLPSEGPYRLAGSNVFVVVGCSSVGQYADQPIRNYVSINAHNYDKYVGQCGPISCTNAFNFEYCNAFDCCVLAIPPSVDFYLLGGGQSLNSSSTCGYSTVLYPPSYSTSSKESFGNPTYGAQLMWALPGGENFSKCSLLEGSAEYACSPSPATCTDVNQAVHIRNEKDKLVGYYCQCLQAGYQGDGYKNGTGCKDIDECTNPSLNQCASKSKAICFNLEGSYNCSCPAGMIGDGVQNGTGCSNDGRKDKMTGLIIGGTTGGTLFLLSCCIASLLIWRLQKRLRILQEFQQALKDRQVQPPFFSYHDLKFATNNFDESNQLGAGAFGAVYKGVLRDGTAIAVKRLFNSEKEQVLREFLNEVVLITGIKHKNLIQLKGCCINNKERILVYEYAENGNLAQALWGKDTQEKLDWVHRLNICMGIARGLSYFHEELEPRIIHRDIKPANILLDNNWNSKIADFGLAKPYMEEESHAAFTLLAGTKGYLAPEYVMEGQLTAKADVYSFGILVLEIISGRKCIDLSLPADEVSLKTMAEDLQNRGKLLELFEPGLIISIPEIEVMKIINIGLACVQTDPSHRPTMSQVVSMLLGNTETTTFIDSNKGDSVQNALDILLATHRYNEDSTSYSAAMRQEFEDSEEKSLLRSQSLPVRIWNRIIASRNFDSTRISMTELNSIHE